MGCVSKNAFSPRGGSKELPKMGCMGCGVLGVRGLGFIYMHIYIYIYIYIWGFLVCFAVGDSYQDRYVNGGQWGPWAPWAPLAPWAHGPMAPVYVTVLVLIPHSETNENPPYIYILIFPLISYPYCGKWQNMVCPGLRKTMGCAATLDVGLGGA